jgi:hypothetical protein
MASEKISVDTAKSIMRVHLAKALAEAFITGVEAADDLGLEQQTTLLSLAMMTYRDRIEDAEDVIEREVDFELLKTAYQEPQSRRVQWATADEFAQAKEIYRYGDGGGNGR